MDAIEYEVRKFNAGYLPGEKSVGYQLDGPAPTDEIDEAWEALYKRENHSERNRIKRRLHLTDSSAAVEQDSTTPGGSASEPDD